MTLTQSSAKAVGLMPQMDVWPRSVVGLKKEALLSPLFLSLSRTWLPAGQKK